MANKLPLMKIDEGVWLVPKPGATFSAAEVRKLKPGVYLHDEGSFKRARRVEVPEVVSLPGNAGTIVKGVRVDYVAMSVRERFVAALKSTLRIEDKVTA